MRILVKPRSPKVLLLMLLSATVVSVTMPQVLANNFGPNSDGDCCLYANNYFHEFFYYDLRSDSVSATNWSRQNNFDPTTVQTNRTYSHDDSDLSVIDGVYDENWAGRYACVDVSNSNPNLCHHAHVWFDYEDWSSFNWDSQRHVACHEIAHSLGLSHRNWGCIEQGALNEFHLSGHDKDHLNNRY